MPEMLQALIDKLQGEAVEEAEAKARLIVAAAEARARDLVAAAEADAGALRAGAERDADASRERGRRELEHAARDVLLALRAQIVATVETALRPAVAAALDGDTLRALLVAVARAHLDAGTNRAGTLTVAARDRAMLLEQAQAAFAGQLAAGVELVTDPDLEAGFRFRLEGEDVVHDVSLDALVEALSALLRPELVALLKHAAARGEGAAQAERDAVRG